MSATRERLDALTAADVLAQLRAGQLDPAFPDLTEPAALWLDRELSRLVTTWPAGHPDELTGAEARIVLALAASADEHGISETPRVDLARSVRVTARDVGYAVPWLRWRGTLTAHRVSAGPGRVDRITLHGWRSPDGRPRHSPG